MISGVADIINGSMQGPQVWYIPVRRQQWLIRRKRDVAPVFLLFNVNNIKHVWIQVNTLFSEPGVFILQWRLLAIRL